MNKEILKELVGEGLSVREIASRFSISQSTIKYWMKKHKLESFRSRGKSKAGAVRKADGFIYTDIHDGIFRWCEEKVCELEGCDKKYYSPKHVKNRQFCSKECADNNRKNRVEVTCDTCGEKFERVPSDLKLSKSGFHFCSRDCKDKAQSFGEYAIKELHLDYYNDGEGRYRIKAFRYKGMICNKCEYKDDDRMLDVHHIDGNRKNNDIDNLAVLCVWCHALETRKNWPHTHLIIPT